MGCLAVLALPGCHEQTPETGAAAPPSRAMRPAKEDNLPAGQTGGGTQRHYGVPQQGAK